MLRVIPLIAILISATDAFSQSVISGRVIDRETGSPVRYAKIYFSESFCGTATNKNGEFAIDTTQCKGEQLIVTAVPYEKITVPVSALDQQQPIEILVQRKELRKTISYDQSHWCGLIDSALNLIPKNYYASGYSVQTFHREHVTYFDNVIQLLEGQIRFSADKSTHKTELKDALYAEEKNQREVFWKNSTQGFYTFGWAPLPGEGRPSQEYFLGIHRKAKKDLSKYYHFSSPGVFRDSAETLIAIDFDQKDNIKGALLKGRLYIDSLSLAIVKVEYSLSPKGLSYILPNRTIGGMLICRSPLHLNILRETSEINFVLLGDKWHLANQITDTQFNAAIDSSSRNHSHYLKIHAERVLTQLDTFAGKISGEPSRTNPVTYNYLKSHFETYDHTKSDWRGQTILKPDTSIAEMIRTMRMSNQLWERKEGRKAKEKLLASTTFSPEELKRDLAYLKDMFLLLHPSITDPVERNHLKEITLSGRLAIPKGTCNVLWTKHNS
jgi:hypothetical protein